MLSLQTERKLAELLHSIADNESVVERQRQRLSEDPDFSPYSLFKFLDRLGLGTVNASDIRDYAIRNNVRYNESEIYAIIKQYDSNSDGRLTLSDFNQLTLPSTSPGLKSLAMNRSLAIGVPIRVRDSFAYLLETELAYHRELENLRRSLAVSLDFSVIEGFRVIDTLRLNSISVDAISRFLAKNGYTLFSDGLEAILRRFDNDSDTRLSYSEFSDLVLSSDSFYRSKVSYPTRQSFSPERSMRASSPLRSPTRYYSPTRTNLERSLYSPPPMQSSRISRSPERSFRASSPLRKSRSPDRSIRSSGNSWLSRNEMSTSSQGFRQSPTRSFRQLDSTNQSFRPSSPLRQSSPLRRSSPTRSPDASFRSSYISTPPRRTQESFRPADSLRSRLAYSPMTEYDEKELVFSFKEQINLDRDLERAKNELSSRPDFNLHDAYSVFDITNRGIITAYEFESTLTQLGIYPRRDEVNLLIKHYSQYSDTCLRYGEFSEIFTPKNYDYASMLRRRGPFRRPLSNPLNAFSRETINILTNVLRLHLDCESKAESLRQSLESRPRFNIKDAFDAVDRNRNGVITMDEFEKILNSYGLFATNSDLKGLMDRYDKNKDGLVSYTEFVQEIAPKSPRKY